MKILIPILLLVAVLFVSGLYIKENFFNTAQCGSITNCASCSKEGGCAWCLNKQACVNTDRFGFPSGRECNGNDVVVFENNCTNVPTNQGRPQTISVVSGDSNMPANNSVRNRTITDASGQPAWLISALKGGFVSGQQSKGADTYRKWMAGEYSLDNASDYKKWLTGDRSSSLDYVGGLGITTGSTYNTGDMSQDYYKQFGQTAPNANLASQSESAITRDVSNRYQAPQLDSKVLEKKITDELMASIQKIISEQLQRNGVRNTSPFQDMELEKELKEEFMNAMGH
jgi:hypothetical protein